MQLKQSGCTLTFITDLKHFAAGSPTRQDGQTGNLSAIRPSKRYNKIIMKERME